MRVNHVKESGAVRGEGSEENRQVGLSVCFSSHGEEGRYLMTRNILYGGQLVGGVECQKSEGRGGGAAT